MTHGKPQSEVSRLHAPLPTNPLIVQSDRTLMLHTGRGVWVALHKQP